MWLQSPRCCFVSLRSWVVKLLLVLSCLFVLALSSEARAGDSLSVSHARETLSACVRQRVGTKYFLLKHKRLSWFGRLSRSWGRAAADCRRELSLGSLRQHEVSSVDQPLTAAIARVSHGLYVPVCAQFFKRRGEEGETLLFRSGFDSVNFEEMAPEADMPVPDENGPFVADASIIELYYAADAPGTYKFKLDYPPGGTASLTAGGLDMMTCNEDSTSCEGEYYTESGKPQLSLRLVYSAPSPKGSSTKASVSKPGSPMFVRLRVARPGETAFTDVKADGDRPCPRVVVKSLGDFLKDMEEDKYGWCAAFQVTKLLPSDGGGEEKEEEEKEGSLDAALDHALTQPFAAAPSAFTRYDHLKFNEHVSLGSPMHRWPRAPTAVEGETTDEAGQLVEKEVSSWSGASITTSLELSESGWYYFELTADPGTRLWANSRLVMEMPLTDKYGSTLGRYEPHEAGADLLGLPIRNRLRVEFTPRDSRVLILRYRLPGSMEYTTIPSKSLRTEGDAGGGCKIDCAVADWLPWGDCSGPCKTRARQIDLFTMNHGRSCGPVEETTACNLDSECPWPIAPVPPAPAVPPPTTRTTTTTTTTTTLDLTELRNKLRALQASVVSKAELESAIQTVNEGLMTLEKRVGNTAALAELKQLQDAVTRWLQNLQRQVDAYPSKSVVEKMMFRVRSLQTRRDVSVQQDAEFSRWKLTVPGILTNMQNRMGALLTDASNTSTSALANSTLVVTLPPSALHPDVPSPPVPSPPLYPPIVFHNQIRMKPRLLGSRPRVLPNVVHTSHSVSHVGSPTLRLRIGFSREIAAAKAGVFYLRVQRVLTATEPTSLDDIITIPINDAQHVQIAGKELQLHLDESAHLQRGATYVLHADPGSIILAGRDDQAVETADLRGLHGYTFTVSGKSFPPVSAVAHTVVTNKGSARSSANGLATGGSQEGKGLLNDAVTLKVREEDGYGSVTLAFSRGIQASLGNAYIQPEAPTSSLAAADAEDAPPPVVVSTLDSQRASVSGSLLTLRLDKASLKPSTPYLLTLDAGAILWRDTQQPVPIGALSFTTPGLSDCAVSPWSSWGPCPFDCVGRVAEQTRLRVLLDPVAAAGKLCPALLDWKPCECVVMP